MFNKFLKSVLAGIAIALGGWIYLSTSNSIVGAFLFACGLLAVRIYGLNLFTGKIQYMITKIHKWYDYPIIFFGNLFGVLIIALVSRDILQDVGPKIAAAKAAQSLPIALVKGIGCGALMS
jgi:formate/nitrite transporter FocA (FNT family)